MKSLADWFASLFCAHEWELIFDTSTVKVYRCKKCGHSQQYKIDISDSIR